jgi:hypothetical protein
MNTDKLITPIGDFEFVLGGYLAWSVRIRGNLETE